MIQLALDIDENTASYHANEAATHRRVVEALRAIGCHYTAGKLEELAIDHEYKAEALKAGTR